jgi:hypothetical protein
LMKAYQLTKGGWACPPCEQGEAGGGISFTGTALVLPQAKQYVAGLERQQGHIIRARSAQSRKRVPSFAVGVTPRRDEFSGLGYHMPKNFSAISVERF